MPASEKPIYNLEWIPHHMGLHNLCNFNVLIQIYLSIYSELKTEWGKLGQNLWPLWNPNYLKCILDGCVALSCLQCQEPYVFLAFSDSVLVYYLHVSFALQHIGRVQRQFNSRKTISKSRTFHSVFFSFKIFDKGCMKLLETIMIQIKNLNRGKLQTIY